MYIEIKTDSPQPIVDLLTSLIAAGDRARVSLSKTGEFLLVEASVNEVEEPT